MLSFDLFALGCFTDINFNYREPVRMLTSGLCTGGIPCGIFGWLVLLLMCAGLICL